MRFLAFYILVFAASGLFADNLKITAGRLMSFYPSNDTLNANSGYNVVAADFERAWSFAHSSAALFTQSGLWREDALTGGGYFLDSRIGARLSKSMSQATTLNLLAAGRLAVGPSYNNATDYRLAEISGWAETFLEGSAYLLYGAGYEYQAYENYPAADAQVYSAEATAGRSFNSGLSLRLNLNAGMKQYRNSGTPLRFEAGLRIGQSLSEKSGVSLLLTGGRVAGTTLAYEIISPLFGRMDDNYAYNDGGGDLQFRYAGDADMSLRYGFRYRAYEGSVRTDNVHILGLKASWTMGESGNGRFWRFSLEPSVNGTESSLEGESYLSVNLLAGFAF